MLTSMDDDERMCESELLVIVRSRRENDAVSLSGSVRSLNLRSLLKERMDYDGGCGNYDRTDCIMTTWSTQSTFILRRDQWKC